MGGRVSGNSDDAFLDALLNAMDDEDDARLAVCHRRSSSGERPLTARVAVWFARNVCPVSESREPLAPPNETATH